MDNNDEALSKEELSQCVSRYNISYCGHANDVRPLLERCSVFVLPSYHEGLPRVVLEAMAVGRAIITTDAPGCRETVTDGQNGFLVPVGDSAKLAEKMLQLAEDAVLRDTMGKQSYKICLAKYDVNLVNRQINQIMLNS